MALCEHCRAELAGSAERLPPPWFDHDHHKVAGRYVPPTPWAVLEVLWRRRGLIVSHESLITLLYGDRADPPSASDRLIIIWACRLRRVLEPTPYAIRNVWGAGYVLVDGGQSVDRTRA